MGFSVSFYNFLKSQIVFTKRTTGFSNVISGVFTAGSLGALLLSFSDIAVSAGPRIAFDNKIIDAGTAVEGSDMTLKAVFSIRNAGDSALRLQSVRPSCGCTRITCYDSLIHGGKSGRIDAEMNLKGFRGGLVAKTITVVSNADNEPVARLLMKATVKEIISVSEPYISLNSSHPSPEKLYLSSQKKDLEITEVLFVAESDPQEISPNWQNSMPIAIPYKWFPLDSLTGDGYRFYRLDLYLPSIERSVLGVFTLKTNHPEKPQILMRGTLLR